MHRSIGMRIQFCYNLVCLQMDTDLLIGIELFLLICHAKRVFYSEAPEFINMHSFGFPRTLKIQFKVCIGDVNLSFSCPLIHSSLGIIISQHVYLINWFKQQQQQRQHTITTLSPTSTLHRASPDVLTWPTACICEWLSRAAGKIIDQWRGRPSN